MAARPWVQADYVAYFEKFLSEHPEMSATKFGYFAVGEGAFMTQLRNRGVTLRRLEKAVDFVKDYAKTEKKETKNDIRDIDACA